MSQSSRVGGSKGLEINSLVIPITYAIRSLFATTSCIYDEPCCLLAASLSSSTPPLPSPFRIMRRYLKRCWQLGDLPPPRWIHESNLQFEHRILCTSGSLLPFQPGDKSKLLFVGLITCLEWIVAFNRSADPFCNWNIDTLIIFDKFLTFFSWNLAVKFVEIMKYYIFQDEIKNACIIFENPLRYSLSNLIIRVHSFYNLHRIMIQRLIIPIYFSNCEKQA